MNRQSNFFVIYPRKSYKEAENAMRLIGYSIGRDCILYSYLDVHDEEDYYQNIVVPAIEKADFVLAFISNGAENEYLLRESVRLCNNLNKSTIPVKLGTGGIKESVWNFRSNIIDFSDNIQRSNLLGQIHAWLGSVVIDGHVCMDLGLPSGTQWATCNIGAVDPEDPGSLYIWGETVPCKKGYSYTAAPLVLPPKADAATVDWGKGWRMPSRREMEELIQNCTWEWAGDGYRLTGPNGCCIFLPNTGYRDREKIYYAGTEGHYWSGTLRAGSLGSFRHAKGLSEEYHVWYLMFRSSYQGVCHKQRFVARAVRAVHSNKAPMPDTEGGGSIVVGNTAFRKIIIGVVVSVCSIAIIMMLMLL